MRIAGYPIPVICSYCSCDVIYTSNSVIYGKEYGNGRVYKCTGCDAYVGVHTGTSIPLGRLANKELRQLKKKCHTLFDPAWKSKKVKRRQAYSILAFKLGIPVNECHFG
ncbi:zinc-finger-containing protein [Paenibacillus taichungensis]